MTMPRIDLDGHQVVIYDQRTGLLRELPQLSRLYLIARMRDSDYDSSGRAVFQAANVVDAQRNNLAVAHEINELRVRAQDIRNHRRIIREYQQAMEAPKQRIREKLAQPVQLTQEALERWVAQHFPAVTNIRLLDGYVVADYVACEMQFSRNHGDQVESNDGLPGDSYREGWRMLLPPLRAVLPLHDFIHFSMVPIINGVPKYGTAFHPHAYAGPGVCSGGYGDDLIRAQHLGGLPGVALAVTLMRGWRKAYGPSVLMRPERVRVGLWDIYRQDPEGFHPIEALNGVIYPTVDDLLASTPRGVVNTAGPIRPRICDNCGRHPCQCCPNCGVYGGCNCTAERDRALAEAYGARPRQAGDPLRCGYCGSTTDLRSQDVHNDWWQCAACTHKICLTCRRILQGSYYNHCGCTVPGRRARCRRCYSLTCECTLWPPESYRRCPNCEVRGRWARLGSSYCMYCLIKKGLGLGAISYFLVRGWRTSSHRGHPWTQCDCPETNQDHRRLIQQLAMQGWVYAFGYSMTNFGARLRNRIQAAACTGGTCFTQCISGEGGQRCEQDAFLTRLYYRIRIEGRYDIDDRLYPPSIREAEGVTQPG